MAVRYFVNTETRRARLGHGQDFARSALADGFTEVNAEQFEDFRAENRARLQAMVAR